MLLSAQRSQRLQIHYVQRILESPLRVIADAGRLVRFDDHRHVLKTGVVQESSKRI